MDAEVLVAQRMASNSAYSHNSNGLRSRERPNKGMEVINNYLIDN